jgi:hypothetical protein
MHPALRGFGADTVVEPSAACDCVQKDALYVVGALVLLGILGTAAFVGTRA